MAVSPDILISALKKKVDAAEKIIDQKLIDKASFIDFSGKVTISTREIDANVIEILRPKYLAAGWTGMTKNTDYYGDLTITLTYKVDNNNLVAVTPTKTAHDVVLGKRKITLDH